MNLALHFLCFSCQWPKLSFSFGVKWTILFNTKCFSFSFWQEAEKTLPICFISTVWYDCWTEKPIMHATLTYNTLKLSFTLKPFRAVKHLEDWDGCQPANLYWLTDSCRPGLPICLVAWHTNWTVHFWGQNLSSCRVCSVPSMMELWFWLRPLQYTLIKKVELLQHNFIYITLYLYYTFTLKKSAYASKKNHHFMRLTDTACNKGQNIKPHGVFCSFSGA